MKFAQATVMLLIFLAGNVLAKDAASVQVTTLAKTSLSWDGSALPRYPSGTPEVTILRIVIPPGVQLPMHKHPVINAGVLLSGELTVKSEHNNTLLLKAGDPIVELVDKWHYGVNHGSVPAEIIVVYAGVQGTPITIKLEPAAK